MVILDQTREKLLDHPVVRKGVDVKGKTDVLLGRVENGFAAGDTSVVDEDSRVTDLGADLLGDGGDFLG